MCWTFWMCLQSFLGPLHVYCYFPGTTCGFPLLASQDSVSRKLLCLDIQLKTQLMLSWGTSSVRIQNQVWVKMRRRDQKYCFQCERSACAQNVTWLIQFIKQEIKGSRKTFVKVSGKSRNMFIIYLEETLWAKIESIVEQEIYVNVKQALWTKIGIS